VPIYGFSQAARNASGGTISQTRTNFGNLGARGLDVRGNPGFIVLTGVVVDNASYVPEYYIWVDAEGDLVMASGPEIENSAEFPNGDWNDASIIDKSTKVGPQT